MKSPGGDALGLSLCALFDNNFFLGCYYYGT